MNFFLKLSLKINTNIYILAIRNSFLSIMPLIVVYSFLGLAINILNQIHIKKEGIDYIKILFNAALSVQNTIPYIFIFLFSQNIFKMKHGKNNLQLGTFSVVTLLLYSIFIDDTSFKIIDSMLLRAIIIGILNYFIFSIINNLFFRYLPNAIKKEANSYYLVEFVFFGLIHIVIFAFLYFFFFKQFPNPVLDLSKRLNFENDSLKVSLIYNLIILLPWLFGINGSQLVSDSYEKLFNHSQENIAYFLNKSLNHYYFDESFFNLYINIGGNGATLCLLLALLIFRKNEYKKFIRLAILPSLFNINEIVILGLPIVGNFILIVPFILVPMIFTILTYIALKINFISSATTYTSWLTPTIISGLVSGQRNFHTVIWQIFLISLGTWIYYFFLKQYFKVSNKLALDEINSVNEIHINYDLGGTHLEYILDSSEANKKLQYLLKKGQLILQFQPIVSNSDFEVLKMESLVRIKHQDLGIVSPYFIKYFKALNKIQELDYWVIEESFKYGKLIKEKEKSIGISINISVETFINDSFVDNIEVLVKKYSIEPENFTLEIVEEACLLDIKNVKRKIDDLRKIGFELAIDDFGTGYSSLSYLLDLSVDYIKIDRVFISNISSTKSEVILKKIVQLCKAVGSKVIIEGVETEEELEIIRNMEVDMIQGYFFYKPNNFDDIMQTLEKTEKR